MDQPTIHSFRKLHKASRHIEFLNACITNGIIPKFCEIGDKVNSSIQLSPRERNNLEKRKLSNELENQIKTFNFHKTEYSKMKNLLSASYVSHIEFLSKIDALESYVMKCEKKNDIIRNQKLHKLIRVKSYNYTKTELINLTDTLIPLDIQNLLELGPNNAIGGYVRNEGSEIYVALNGLHEKVRNVARKLNIDEFSIEDLRCTTMRTGRKLSFCNTQDTRVEKFLTFKRDNPEILFMKCDKSKNICVMYKKDYAKKLNELFRNNNDFSKIENFDLGKTIAEFKNLLKTTINPSLSNKSKLSIKPQPSISSLYGKVKDHKINYPLRPIGTSYDSLTLGAENFINNLFSPLRGLCTYAIKSQVEFKNEMLKTKSIFDPSKHEIFSFDVISLFPNINNTRTINFILNEVFKAPSKFFNETDKTGKVLPVPSREKLRKFLHGVLNNFNIFECQTGIFSQKRGVKMGSPLSSLLADLFLSIMERTVIEKLEKQGIVVKWIRYVDDCICVAKKGSFQNILNKINKWDKNIKFSYEKMLDNKLNFLSSTIFLENDTFEFRPYRKQASETILSNFRKAIISEKYLISNIFTMLHLSKNSSSTHEILLYDMENNLKPILLNNAYPLKLIKSKFTQFLQNGPKPKPPDVIFTLNLPYTSRNMDYHIKKMINDIKLIMPTFHIRLVYKSIRVSNLFSADSKPKKSDILESTNCCYQFKCLCKSHYVGMTARMIKTRATEHRNPSSAKGIYYHINSCPTYLFHLAEFERKNSNANTGKRAKKKIKDSFFMQHFKILQKRFRSYFERRKTEAFFIRILRPDLNDQKDHNCFALF